MPIGDAESTSHIIYYYSTMAAFRATLDDWPIFKSSGLEESIYGLWQSAHIDWRRHFYSPKNYLESPSILYRKSRASLV